MNKIFDLKLNFSAFKDLMLLLTRHRFLTFELAKREINDRYAGQFFGTFWAFGHPLIQMAVYVFVFGFVFQIKMGGTVDLPRDYTTYLLSGLIPWLAFLETMAKASTIFAANSNLVKQVVFPIEVLPIKGVIASLFTQFVFISGLVVYVFVVDGELPLTYLFIPVLLVLQILAMIGVSLIISSVAVFIRDVKDFVQIFSVVGIYLMPVIYLPESIPPLFRSALNLNPFSYLIWCYQDVLYFGGLNHPIAWIVFPATSLLVFVMGYRFFRKIKVLFGNVL